VGDRCFDAQYVARVLIWSHLLKFDEGIHIFEIWSATFCDAAKKSGENKPNFSRLCLTYSSTRL